MNKFNSQNNIRSNDYISKQISKTLIVAGGCFWGLQKYYSMVKGVIETTVGYSGGDKKFPKYEEVCAEVTGHTEAVIIKYDPEKTNIPKLLDHFFFIVDPTTLNYQKNDYGTHYRSALFYNDNNEKKLIEDYIQNIQKNYKNKIVVELIPAKEFWAAENYHQDYLNKNPYGYCHITYKHFNRIKEIDEMI